MKVNGIEVTISEDNTDAACSTDDTCSTDNTCSADHTYSKGSNGRADSSRFGRIGRMRPERIPAKFHVYWRETFTSPSGREKFGEPVFKRMMFGILSSATTEEKTRFSQLGKNVTHKILQQGAPDASDSDILRLVEDRKETRTFRICGVHNVGALNQITMYYCLEREDTDY